MFFFFYSILLISHPLKNLSIIVCDFLAYLDTPMIYCLDKAYIHCNAHEPQLQEDPFQSLLDTLECVMTERAHGRFKNTGYIVQLVNILYVT